MNRISIKDIEARISYLNKITCKPETAYTKIDGKLSANIGHYHLAQAYGGCALYRMDNESGGVDDVSRIGYASKKELYQWINAYITELQAKVKS